LIKGEKKMNFGSLESAQATAAAQRDEDEFKAKRVRALMVGHNREMKARKDAEADAKVKIAASKQLKKDAAIQKNLEIRVRQRILSSPAATLADVSRLFDKTRDEILAEDGPKAEKQVQEARRSQAVKARRAFSV
jgi:hypothetical protein